MEGSFYKKENNKKRDAWCNGFSSRILITSGIAN